MFSGTVLQRFFFLRPSTLFPGNARRDPPDRPVKKDGRILSFSKGAHKNLSLPVSLRERRENERKEMNAMRTLQRWTALFLTAALLLMTLPSLGEGGTSFSDRVARESVLALLQAADRALEEGEDGESVLESMALWAEEHGLSEALSRACENIAAQGNEVHEKILAYDQGENTPHQLYEAEDVTRGDPASFRDEDSGNVYELIPVSDALRNLLADPAAQFCYEPIVWTEAGFRQVFGKDFKSFKPSSPRAGYVCVVISADTQVDPGTKWTEMTWSEKESEFFQDALYQNMLRLEGWLDEDGPVLTGNPHLASEFWVFDVRYPFYALYGEKGEVKGYNCTLTFTALQGDSRREILKATAKNQLDNVISSWSDWIAKADVPVLTDLNNWESIVEKLRSALRKERSEAAADQKITPLNARRVVNGLLIRQGDTVRDAWQKAIYEAGAENVILEDGQVRMTLRPFGTAVPGSYKTAEDREAWLRTSLSTLMDYTLEVTLPLQDGKPTAKGLNALKNTVGRAAGEAKKVLGGKEMGDALWDTLFPVPAEGKTVTSEQLLSPSQAFVTFAENRLSSFASAPARAWSALFHLISRQNVNAQSGPHGILLNMTGAQPEALLMDALRSLMDTQAFLPREERIGAEDLEEAFLSGLAGSALKMKKSSREKMSMTVDLDEIARGRLPEAYEAFLSAFAYDSALEILRTRFGRLPDIPAVEMPRTGRISGSASGTRVNIRLSSDSEGTYVQMRDADTDTVTVSAFIQPGKQVSLNVPKGMYTIRWCSGPYWYGEELLFGDAGSYSKSEATEILGPGYVHSFTLESVSNGDISVYGASPADFR